MSPKVSNMTKPALSLVSVVALAGCLGPTYGTDKTASEQLMEDLGSAISLGREKERINYAPRPDLVQPPNTTTLPTPQQSVVEQEGVWPESPEQRRARIRSEIDDGRVDPRFVTNPNAVAAVGASEGPQQVGAPGTRRVYLTDPPSEYRIPSQTAAVGETGESEAAKARRGRSEKTGLRRFIPWL